MPESIVDFSVGNMNFRKAPENKDGFYRHRNAHDKNGDLTYISKGSKGMNYNNPVTKDGKPTRYFQILMEIVANPGITKKEIIKNIYSKNKYKPSVDPVFYYKHAGRTSNVVRGWESEAPGYLSLYFTGLHADGFLRITTKGEYFPTAKGSDFVQQHIDDVDPKYLEEDKRLFDSILEEKSNNNNDESSLSKIKESEDFEEDYFDFRDDMIHAIMDVFEKYNAYSEVVFGKSELDSVIEFMDLHGMFDPNYEG